MARKYWFDRIVGGGTSWLYPTDGHNVFWSDGFHEDDKPKREASYEKYKELNKQEEAKEQACTPDTSVTTNSNQE